MLGYADRRQLEKRGVGDRGKGAHHLSKVCWQAGGTAERLVSLS